MKISPSDLHVFILGSYVSIDGSKTDLNRLHSVETHLMRLGYDAFLAIHRNTVGSRNIAKLGPRLQTQELVRFADLNLFIFTKSGVRDGLVAELTETQTSQPQLTDKHVALIETGFTLSSILDQSQTGILSIGPIRIVPFDNDQELLETAQQLAFNYFIAKRDGTSV